MRRYTSTQVPTTYERHLLNRMGTGFSRAGWAQMRTAGGALQWFEQQLRPEGVVESSRAEQLVPWFPDLTHDPVTMWTNQTSGVKGGWEYARDLEALTLLRRVYSKRPVLETMVDFWANHLHVPASGDVTWVFRASYDELLRTHALGRFDDLLTAATLHPAMLLYLDTWRSVRRAPNENHGRELLELHTVGRAAGYTEAMVKDAAKILSGHTVDAHRTWTTGYDENRHATGPVQVLGFVSDNAAADGRQVTLDFLRYLAHHPATARTIARRLAVRFVSDDPSVALVDRLAQVYLDNDTEIRPVLRALVRDPEFRTSVGRKVRTPHEDLVATARVLDVRAKQPSSLDDFANAIVWSHGGMQLYSWPRPDGAPETSEAYASVTRMLSSFRMHWNQAGGYWPDGAVAYRSPAHWFPQKRIRFDQYVDHLCRTFHGTPADAQLLKVACQATGIRAGETVERSGPLGRWLGVRLIAALLDTPRHMSR